MKHLEQMLAGWWWCKRFELDNISSLAVTYEDICAMCTCTYFKQPARNTTPNNKCEYEMKP